MAKKEKQILCDSCIFFTDKCEHESNLRVFLKRRIETVTYKSLDKKTECEFFKCLEN